MICWSGLKGADLRTSWGGGPYCAPVPTHHGNYPEDGHDQQLE